ncbi:MAG: 2Fe-2S iron-sulfur cluster-binding protein [Candidatus Thermoplasmatota archaeon]
MGTVSLTIDGKTIQIEEGKTVLHAAQKAGIEIPTLCHHDQLEPYGACRLCMVEIEKNNRKKLVASCCYPVENGLIVRTKTDSVDKIRKMLIELLLSNCPSGEHVEMAKKYGITQSRFKQADTPESPCSLCGLCVRYCNEIKKEHAVCFVGRGVDRAVALVPGVSDVCKTCRACFSVCDAGKIVYLVDMVQDISCPPLRPMKKQ